MVLFFLLDYLSWYNLLHDMKQKDRELFNFYSKSVIKVLFYCYEYQVLINWLY